MRGRIDSESFLYIVLGLIFLIIPFDELNHSLLYFLQYVIALVGISTVNKEYTNDKWFRYYLCYLIWCVVATALSYNKILSLRQLIAVGSPLFIYVAINELAQIDKIRFIATLNRWVLWLSGLLLVILVICNLPFKNAFINMVIYAVKDGSRIYLSTVSLCCLVYVLYFSTSKIFKFVTLAIVIASNLFYHDGAFWFVLVMVLILYWVYIRQFRLIRIFIASIIAIFVLIVTFFVLTKIVKYNLHIYERLLVFQYWLPKLLYSPIYGIGLGLGQLHEFYVSRFPVDPDALKINPFIAFHAHNIFIDMALAIGFPGLILFLWLLGITIIDLGKRYSYDVCGYISILLVVLGKNCVDDLFEGSKGLFLWLMVILVYISINTRNNIK